MHEGILAHLYGIEDRLARWASGIGVAPIQGLRIPVTPLPKRMWIISSKRYAYTEGGSGLPTRLCLIHWGWHANARALVDHTVPGQKYSELRLGDLVCMAKEEAAVHGKEVLKGSKTPRRYV